MIDFYSYGTINGQAVALTLEELSLDYRLIPVDLMRGAHRQPEFLALNPSGRIPVIIDHDAGTETPLVISQTGAIMIYLAEKAGRLLSNNTALRARTLEWLCFQLTDISTNVFNNFYLKSLVKPQQETAGDMLKQRAVDFYHVFDQQLFDQRYIVGDELSIADLATYPVVNRLRTELQEVGVSHLLRWHDEMAQRPSVGMGLKLFE